MSKIKTIAKNCIEETKNLALMVGLGAGAGMMFGSLSTGMNMHQLAETPELFPYFVAIPTAIGAATGFGTYVVANVGERIDRYYAKKSECNE